MSRIYFHSPSGTMEIYGSERAYMSIFINDVAASLIEWSLRLDVRRIEPFLPHDCYLRDTIKFQPERAALDSILTWLNVTGECLIVDGCEYDVFPLVLNTGLALLNDSGKLFARLHGACEIHAFCEGHNRSWLANIVQEGVGSGLYRDEDRQWSNLADWLRLRDDEPVVTSYSVTEPFPSPFVAGWDCETDEDCDAWYELPEAVRWEQSMKGLRGEDVNSDLELKPDNWKEFRFGHGKDMYWVGRQVMQQTNGGI